MIPHNKPTLGNREILAVQRVIESSWVAQGREVASFEEELCDFFGLPDEHVVVVSSGTAALFLALWTLDSKGARIGMPVYSCSALRNAVEMVGATPVYFDCAKGSPNLDLNTKQLFTIDILIAPSMYGIPIDLKHAGNCKIIEDLAQAFGAEEGGQPIGLRGVLGITSFYATKLLTSGGQGGAIFSKNKNLIDAIRDYREFDNRRDEKIRFNFQMTDIQAAIGREQLKQFKDFRAKRDLIFSIYKSSGIDIIDSDDDKYTPIRYRAVLKTNYQNKIIDQLKENGIGSIVPIEKDELLDNPDNYVNAMSLSESTISLPIYPSLDMRDANKIHDIVAQVEDGV
jgi:perosamine synthetase